MGLFDDWEGFDVQEERKNGREMKLISQVCKKLKAGWDIEKIKEVFEDDEFDINVICNEAMRNGPDYDVDKIYNELAKKQPAETK